MQGVWDVGIESRVWPDGEHRVANQLVLLVEDSGRRVDPEIARQQREEGVHELLVGGDGETRLAGVLPVHEVEVKVVAAGALERSFVLAPAHPHDLARVVEAALSIPVSGNPDRRY